jgi:hypothetical protein
MQSNPYLNSPALQVWRQAWLPVRWPAVLSAWLPCHIAGPGSTALSRLIALLLILSSCFSTDLHAAEDSGNFGLTSFTFANYLGTGFYKTSGNEVFVIQLPFEHTIREMTDEQPGWLLKLPVTVGIINYDSIVKDETLPKLNDVTTLTFLPGIEYQYPVTSNWHINPFFDYGFARDFNYANYIMVTGIGIKSYANFKLRKNEFLLGNKFLYAAERSQETGNNLDYSLLETGLNYRIHSNHTLDSRKLDFNVYYVYYYYPNDLVFLERTTTPIRVGHEYEIGITVSNLPDFMFLEKPQIGLGIRRGSNVTVYRLVFGMPF